MRFGRLTVLSYSHKNSYGDHCWNCLCDCGKEIIRNGCSMRRGKVKSCGCFRKEVLKSESHSKAVTTHGKTGSKVWFTWRSMLQRCHNPKNRQYHAYGGRGIKVTKRWLKFENFYKDMGDPPTSKHSLDRIDNEKGYSKKNCRWATTKEQSRNKRTNIWITHNGQTMVTADWAKQIGIARSALWFRLDRGLSIEDALQPPMRKRKK